MINRLTYVVASIVLMPSPGRAQVNSYWLFEEPSNREIERQLENRTDLRFDEVALADVVEHIRTVCEIPCRIKPSALDAVGLGPDVAVTYRGRNVRIRDALTVMLGDLELTWMIDHHHLIVTTPEDAEQSLLTKAYDVRSFVEAEWRPVVRQGSFGRSETVYVRSCDSRWLIRLITTTVNPTSWDWVGGPGSIDTVCTPRIRALVISQTADVHQQIEILFRNLAKLRSAQPLPTRSAGEFSPRQIKPLRSDANLQWNRTMRSSQLRTTGR